MSIVWSKWQRLLCITTRTRYPFGRSKTSLTGGMNITLLIGEVGGLGRSGEWGIWIEPGMRDLILRFLHDTVRAEDPDATIMINRETDEKKTQWSLSAKYCDVLGLDFYPNYMRSTPVDASEVKFSSEVKNATGLPVYVAETGYPSGPSFFGYDNAKQAEYVRSACMESFRCDDISALSLWRYSDSYWKSFPFQENYFGLLTKEGNPKPAWIEYNNQIKASR